MLAISGGCPLVGFQAVAAGLGRRARVGASRAAEEVTLKGRGVRSALDHLRHSVQALRRSRQRDRQGRVQIRIVGGPEAVPADGQAQAVKIGVLDLASIPPAYYKSAMVEGDAQVLSNMTVAEQRKSGAYAMLNKIATDKHERSITSPPTAWACRFIFYVTKDMPVAKPRRPGRACASAAQPNYNAIFKKYSIAGVNVAAPEVYTALERGVVQGYGWPLWGINDFGWDKLTKMRVDPGLLQRRHQYPDEQAEI